MATRTRRSNLLALVAPELEQQLVQTSSDGDLEAFATAVLDLQTRHDLTAEPVEELLGYVLSCAAAHSRVDVLEFLLHGTETSTGVRPAPAIRKCLLHGVCRNERFFPRRLRFQCCFALRYLAFAAVVCVEHKALPALEFLVQRHAPASLELLVDVDVLRCFRLALDRGSDFYASAPETYRPLLLLLLRRYPALLLPLVDGKQERGANVENAGGHEHVDALRSSLLYEYTTNPQLQTSTEGL